MRFHCGISFRFKDIVKYLKWLILILFGLFAFIGIGKQEKALALTNYNVQSKNVTDLVESFYTCDSYTDTCQFIVDNTTGTGGAIPWQSIEIEAKDYTGIDDYIVQAIRVIGIQLFNPVSVTSTIPANSYVTVSFQFKDLDKFQLGRGFNNPGVAVRNLNNGWTYGTYNQTFVCNGNSCTLTYKTGNEASRGVFVYWNIGNTNKNDWFAANFSETYAYRITIQSVNIQYDNANQEISNSINQQTQIQQNWYSTINETIQDGQEKTYEYLTDNTPPSVDTSSVGNVSGLLPPGPVDSLLNIPVKYLNKTISSLGGVCTPFTFNFVFDEPITLPCFGTFYNDFPVSAKIFTEYIPAGFILILYFKHLYKKVDRATSMKTSSDDEWGVI